jgi:hypothetical protein
VIKVLLLILMYNTSTGEIVSVYQQNGKLPGFPSMQACQEAVKNDLPSLKAPVGYSLSAKCVEPEITT